MCARQGKWHEKHRQSNQPLCTSLAFLLYLRLSFWGRGEPDKLCVRMEANGKVGGYIRAYQFWDGQGSPVDNEI